MPKRSTRFQAIVYFIRNHLAEPGVTVTESKFLTNQVTGKKREVDIVIEGELDGEPVTICMEVIEHQRRADITWVESMLKKHENLPTNRLLLVSQSGFTRQSIAMIESQSGRVKALTPQLEEKAEAVGVRRIFTDSLTTHADGCTVRLIAPPDFEKLRVTLEADVDVYNVEGEPLGPLGFLVRDAMNLPNVKQSFLAMAREHPESENLKGFKTLFPIPQLHLFVLNNELDRPELIEALEIWGSVTYVQDEGTLSQAELGGRKYRFGDGLFAGRPAVWVETTDTESGTGKLSWRWVDKAADGQGEYVYHFPEIQQLSTNVIEPLED